MLLIFYWYFKCGMCCKVKKWFEEYGKEINEIYIVEQFLSKEELKVFYEKSGLDFKKFFNMSGMKYCELNFKEKLYYMLEDEQFELLVLDGMLIKCLFIIDGEKVIVGFKED